MQYKIRKRITECKISYKNKVQSCHTHSHGYRPKIYALNVTDDYAFSIDLNTFYCHFDEFDYSVQQGMAVDGIKDLAGKDVLH